MLSFVCRELADQLRRPAPSDILIAVVGITGAGKSTLISKVVDEDVGVGHNLTSCQFTSAQGLENY